VKLIIYKKRVKKGENERSEPGHLKSSGDGEKGGF